MKIISIGLFILLLTGCSWFQSNETQNPSTLTPNETMKTSQLKDLFAYFDERGLEYTNASDLEVVDVNAHEGRMFDYQQNPVYVYRMNRSDTKIAEWMNEIKNTGKVIINQNGVDESFDALINGEYLLVTKAGTDLSQLSEVFTQYEVK